ncbi:RNA-directed DNA polymerase, eukaryota, partial [Tanacetum coccineum]
MEVYFGVSVSSRIEAGRPIGSFLFILIMESLHLSFNRAVEAGIFIGLRIDDALTISHLFYADDAIFIGEWSKENLKGGNMSLFKSLGMRRLHKLTKRLSKWKLKTLSIGGRLTLLKSVLGSTPIYNMSIFKVPKTVLNKMENLRRNFFQWYSRRRSKDYVLFSAIHGIKSLSDPFYCVTLHMNSIIKEFNYLKVQGVDVFSHCKIRIGNGLHTRFWKDLWIGDCTLSGLFPRLFALDTEKDISVAGKLQSPLVSSFRRNVRGGIEEQQLEHLVALLDSVILSNSNDRWVSDLNGDGVFRVKDVRNLLDEFFLPRADIPTRWVKNIPIKVNIFAWKLALDRLPTRANLVQRNVVTESQSCPLCDAILEDTSHLFFNCSLARDVTRLLCRWWNLGVQFFSSYAEWLVWFNSVRLASNLKVCSFMLYDLDFEPLSLSLSSLP